MKTQTWCGLTDSQRSRGRMTYTLQQERLHSSETRRRIYSEILQLTFFFSKTEGRESCWRGGTAAAVSMFGLWLLLSPSSLVCLCLGSLCLALAPEPTHTSAPLPTPWTRCLKSSGGSASYAWEKGMSCVDKRRLSEPGQRRFLRLVSCAPMFSLSGVCVCVLRGHFGLHRYTIQDLLRFW